MSIPQREFVTWGVLDEILIMEVEDSIEGFNINVHNIIANNTIRIEPDNRYSPKAWWSTEVQRLFRLRNAFSSMYYKTRKIEDLYRFQEADDDLKQAIELRKRENFNLYLDQFSTTLSFSQFWKFMKNVQKYKLDKDINQSWNDQQKGEFVNLISDCTSSEYAACVTLEEPRDVLPSFDFVNL